MYFLDVRWIDTALSGKRVVCVFSMNKRRAKEVYIILKGESIHPGEGLVDVGTNEIDRESLLAIVCMDELGLSHTPDDGLVVHGIGQNFCLDSKKVIHTGGHDVPS